VQDLGIYILFQDIAMEVASCSDSEEGRIDLAVSAFIGMGIICGLEMCT
jgi:hypothetical protein